MRQPKYTVWACYVFQLRPHTHSARATHLLLTQRLGVFMPANVPTELIEHFVRFGKIKHFSIELFEEIDK